MAATIKSGANPRIGPPIKLVPLSTSAWDVNRDGTRFLQAVSKEAPLRTIALVQNWSAHNPR